MIYAFAILFIYHVFKDPYTMEDLPYYVEGFYEVNKNSFGYILDGGVNTTLKAELTWHFLCKILSSICPHYIILFIFVSFITLGGYYQAIKKYSPYFWISVILILVGPFEQSLFVLRQHMAMGIVFFSYPYIINKQIKSYLLIVLMAIIIHKTAIVFFPVYFIYNTRINIKWICAGLIIGTYLVVGVVMSLLSDVLMALGVSDYNDYLVSDAETNWKMGGLMLALFLFRLYVMQENALQDGINRLLTIIAFMASLIGIFGIGNPITSRINMYFTSVVFLIIPNTAVNIPSKFLKHLYIIIVMAFYITMWFVADHQYTERYRLLI